MKGIKFNIDETKYFGLTKNYGKKGCFVHIYLRTHYRYYKDEDILITSISRTVAHEETTKILVSRNLLGVYNFVNKTITFKYYNFHNSLFGDNMINSEIKTRSPIDFMDCLTVLRKDGCMACSFREKRLGNWEQCLKRLALKYNGEGVPAYR